MALTKFPIADRGDVAVNVETLWAATAADGAQGVRLLWDSAREIVVDLNFEDVRTKLGAGFVELSAAGEGAPWLVNRSQILAVIPHPQHADVCFIQGHVRRLSVSGVLDAVLARL